MEALAALSIACNVMQVISFSREVITIARKVYEKGVVEEDVRFKASHLDSLTTKIDDDLMRSRPNTLEQRQIDDIARECRSAAKELNKVLANLEGPGDKRNVLHAATVAAKVMWRKRQIQKLEKSMIQWQQVLDSGLLIRLCSQHEAQTLAQSASFHELNETLQRVVRQLSQGNSSLSSIIASESAAVQGHMTAEVSRAAAETRAHITNESQSAALRSKRDRLLRSLKYDGMNSRANTIQDAQEDTFEWIFSSEPQAWSSFTEWLQNPEEKIYWISGKPGSGKSTLMRFIAHDERTIELLSPGTLVVSHYLWLAGSPLQKSIRGVYLSLLHQLLLEDDVMFNSGLLESGKFSLKDEVGDWSVPDLRACLETSLRRCPRQVCIFLDGLDEIDPSEGAHEILKLVDGLLSIPGTKACVASRLEPAFIKQYGTKARLRLQDLTSKDIKLVCESSLRKYHSDTLMNGGCSGLNETTVVTVTSEITSKADGVFLWVHLALKCILVGFTNEDPLEDLLGRLEKLPPDLNQLYESMWKRANYNDRIYEEDASICLNLVIHHSERNPFRDLSPVVGLVAAIDDTIQMDVFGTDLSQLNIEAMESRLEVGMRRIETRCAGLVEFFHSKRTDPSLAENYQELSTLEPWSWYALYFDASASPLRKTESQRLLRFLTTEFRLVHRSAFDFLTNTDFGSAILRITGSTPQERRIRLLRGRLVLCSLWPLLATEGASQPRTFHIALERIVDEFPQDILHHKEPEIMALRPTLRWIWEQARPLWESREHRDRRLEFPGFLASHGLFSMVQAEIDTMQASQGQSIAPAYRNYLLFESCVAVAHSFESEAIALDAFELISWLRLEGADVLARFPLHFRSAKPEGGYLLVSSVALLVSTALEWPRYARVSALGFQRLMECILEDALVASVKEQKMVLRIILGRDHLVLEGLSLVPYRDYDFDEFPELHLEVSLAFVIDLLEDIRALVLLVGRRGAGKSEHKTLDEFGAPICLPTARILFGNKSLARLGGDTLETADGFTWRSKSSCFIEEDLLRSVMASCCVSGLWESETPAIREERVKSFVDLINATKEGFELEWIRTPEGFLDTLKDHVFVDETGKPKSDMDCYPPPMFD